MNIRDMLEAAANTVGFQLSDELARQRNSIDMYQLEQNVLRLMVLTDVIGHALEVMKQGMDPLSAIVHASNCTKVLGDAKPLDDEEFMRIFESWRSLCHRSV